MHDFKMLLWLSALFFLVGVVLSEDDDVSVPQICQAMSPCGADCYTTCDNPCQCDLTADKKVPFPRYGGECRDVGFCEGEFAHLEDCIEKEGPTCPKMLGMTEAVERYSTFDFRVDVRTVEEWEEGHANMSIPTPGLAKTRAEFYMDKLGGKEHSNILVYCKSGGRAFEAATHLLKFGFSNVNSFYHGGFPDLNKAIKEHSDGSENHPTKALCYVSGGSDVCPIPLPTSHITSVEDITNLGRRVILVDVRPKARTRLSNAVRVPSDNNKKIKKFLKKNSKYDVTIVAFCKGGDESFATAKKMKELWDGDIYWVDNGGYKFLKELGWN